jgi:hypothetical protein
MIDMPSPGRTVPRRRHTNGVIRWAAAGITALLLAACGASGAATPGTSSASPPQARPSSTAKLALISPSQGQVFTSSTIPVKVDLQDATIVPTTSTNLKPDEGHLHLFLDNQIVSMNYQKDAVLHDVTPGQHLLRVEFVATDHAPFDPRVIAQVTFEVKS